MRSSGVRLGLEHLVQLCDRFAKLTLFQQLASFFESSLRILIRKRLLATRFGNFLSAEAPSSPDTRCSLVIAVRRGELCASYANCKRLRLAVRREDEERAFSTPPSYDFNLAGVEDPRVGNARIVER